MRAGSKRGRIIALASCAALFAGLGGCERTTAWEWSPDHGHGAVVGPGDRPMHPAGTPHADAVDPGVAVFARSGVPGSAEGLAYRRDASIPSRAADALPDRLAWPEASRADLGRTRSVRTSRSADRWVYPDTRRDTRRGHSRRGGPVYPPYRGW